MYGETYEHGDDGGNEPSEPVTVKRQQVDEREHLETESVDEQNAQAHRERRDGTEPAGNAESLIGKREEPHDDEEHRRRVDQGQDRGRKRGYLRQAEVACNGGENADARHDVAVLDLLLEKPDEELRACRDEPYRCGQASQNDDRRQDGGAGCPDDCLGDI